VAACNFVDATSGVAGIGELKSAPAILKEQAGTLVVPGKEQLELV
jgi:carbamate kinase